MNAYKLAVCLVLSTVIGGCAQTADQPQTITLEQHSQETLRLKSRIADLESRLQNAEQANAELQEENAELSKRIEMLKVLDQAVEEKRKNYSSK